jgi:hypothetical protein
MGFFVSCLIVIAVFIITELLTLDFSMMPWAGAILAAVLIGTFTSETTVQDLSRSDISYSRHSVEGEKVVYVRHQKTSEEFDDPYVYEHLKDTTRVDFKLEKTTNAWLWAPRYEIVADTRVP